jgi:hypothetical protein
MKEPAAVSDGHVLAESYEALRKDVLEGGEGGRTLRGRALLMFKGMAAWMKRVGEAPEAPVCTRVPATGNEMRLPVGIEQNLIDIVATMAFATALGDRA